MNDLTIIEGVKAIDVFTKGGLDPLIEKIEKDVLSLAPDISTDKGRKEIASTAYRVARTKTALDDLGKELTEDWKKQSKAVDEERRKAWDRLEALQKKVRSPLTDWENTEKQRIAGHEDALLYIQQLGDFLEVPTTEQIEARIKGFSALAPRNWQEFESRYTAAVKTLSGALEVRLKVSQKQDAERAELQRLQKAEQERLAKERDELIAKEAAEKARLESEAKSKAEADALAAKVKVEAEKADQARIAIEKEKIAAEERAKKSESDRIAAEEKAKSDAIAALDKAKRDAELSAQKEREKIEAEKKAEADATAKREADITHKAKINNEALKGIIVILNTAISPTDQAKAVVAAIAKGQIPNVKIQY